MRDLFELRDADVAGRIAELTVPRTGLTVETPALLPVINPHIETVSPARMAELGVEIIITNAYIFHGSDDRREAVEREGLHEHLGFDGAIMTDSGSFQLAEYGEIDVTTEEIVEFQHQIGSDIATPVDIPTPPDVDRERAERELHTTQDRIERAATLDVGDMLLTAPIQGSTYPDLREASAAHAYATGLEVFPIGAMVPLLNDYRFADIADLVVAAKRGLGADAPVHLFGAGHPMMFALAVAMGCDLFDSAAYALYARDGRYLTVRGTRHLDDLDYFPCECPVCTARTPEDLRAGDESERERMLAEHNLNVSLAEIRRIKQAIRRGDLLELVEARARAHPTMLDGYRALLDHADWLEQQDPVGDGPFFSLSAESARRPEVHRHHARLDRLAVPDRVLLATDLNDLPRGINDDYDGVWPLTPPFGPYPPALTQTTPLTAEVPSTPDRQSIDEAIAGIRRLAEANPESAFGVYAPDWPFPELDLPENLSIRSTESTDSSPSRSDDGR